MTPVLDPPRLFVPDVSDDLTRRRLLTGGAAAGLLIAAGRGVQPAAGAEPEKDAFPVTIEHRFGSTEIPAEPKRIVCVGELEQDALLALGVVPVAATKWVGEYPGAIYPWAQDRLGDAPLPQVLEPSYSTGGVQFERIAALRPDLILAVYSSIERADYDKLTQIAPTVAQPKGYSNYTTPWQVVTRIVGRAVGQPERADQLVAGVEARFTEARAAHPEFAGAMAVQAADFGDGGYTYYPLSGSIMADLGFVDPAELVELAGGLNYGQLSGERVDLFDADVLVWYYVDGERQRAQIRANPLYADLDVATQGRDVFLYSGDVLTEALTIQSVLSIPFLLDSLVPMLAAAVDGDPATTAQAAS